MADLGDILGSMISGIIRARRVADEETVALAEYYRGNPLLAELTVPRIRIPELTIDFPMLLINIKDGSTSKLQDADKIKAAILSQINEIVRTNKIKLAGRFIQIFKKKIGENLTAIDNQVSPVTNEIVSREIQRAFTETKTETRTKLTREEQIIIARSLRTVASNSKTIKESISTSIIANVKTSDVKELATPDTVARLKITLREEGLEWLTQATDDGGEKHTLQPE